MKRPNPLLLLAVTCLIASFSTPDLSAAQYALTDIGILPGYQQSLAHAINDSGQIVGTADGVQGQQGFLYNNGSMIGLGPNTDARAINASGVVTGIGFPTGFIYDHGTMTHLPTMGTGTYSWGYGINNGGVVVGRAENNNQGNSAFVYSGGVMTDLGFMGNIAVAINSGETIIGDGRSAWAYTADPVSAVYLYLGDQVSGINDQGVIVGYNSYHAFVYANGRETDLGTLGGDVSGALAINNAGQIVGSSAPTPGNNVYPHAFIYEHGAMSDLNNLIAPGSGWTLREADSINNLGQIVGYGINPSGQQDAFLLTPVPEPTAPALMALMAGCLLLIKCRRESVALAHS